MTFFHLSHNVVVKKVLLFILANSKYLGRKMKFSFKDSLPVKTIAGVCDVSSGTQILCNRENYGGSC